MAIHARDKIQTRALAVHESFAGGARSFVTGVAARCGHSRPGQGLGRSREGGLNAEGSALDHRGYRGLRLQLRAEFYNFFNHTQYSAVATGAIFNPAGAQTNAEFGQYTAAQNPRIIQLAARIQF